MTMNRPSVLIVGSGIGGLTAAIALRARGIPVEICEAAPGPRTSNTALGIASNATKVLRALGIDLGDGRSGQATERLEVRTATGELLRALPAQTITAEVGNPIVCIRRNDLMAILQDACGDTPIHYGAEAVRVDAEYERPGIRCADGRVLSADVVVGADGIGSVVRAAVAGQSPPTEAGYVCWLATVSFSHPRMVRGYTGQYWGVGQRFGLTDIGGGSAYWWGTKNMAASQARRCQAAKRDIVEAYRGWAPEVVDVISVTPEATIVSLPAQDRPFLSEWGRGAVTLLGDAAHPMLDALGQGASSAIEDGFVLAEALDRGGDLVAALRTYEDVRRKRTRILVRSARRLSRLEQSESRVLRAVRNYAVAHAPNRILAPMYARPLRFDLEGLV
jgi:2-polyprenyl-6-methoxyphenol hydroxylase-like FAD-dependent oxidoreductase